MTTTTTEMVVEVAEVVTPLVVTLSNDSDSAADFEMSDAARMARFVEACGAAGFDVRSTGAHTCTVEAGTLAGLRAAMRLTSTVKA